MKQIYVNTIDAVNGITHGYAVLNETVAQNMAMMYSGEMNKLIINALINNPLGEGYFFDRFCQFIIYLQFRKTLGLSMQVSDFHNNTQAAFDYYMELFDKGWTENDAQKIMEIFNDIDDNKQNLAQMIIINPFP